MANIIAVIWDCDKTLIDGYMQDPIFKDYNINASEFLCQHLSELSVICYNNFYNRFIRYFCK